MAEPGNKSDRERLFPLPARFQSIPPKIDFHLEAPVKQASHDAFVNSQWKDRFANISKSKTLFQKTIGKSRLTNNVLETAASLSAHRYERYSDIVGHTPLIDITNLLPSEIMCNNDIRVLAKCEFLNPGFSIKDRMVQNILNTAEAEGKLRPGMTIVVASSGNTGASTAMLSSIRGYKCIVTTTSSFYN